MSVFLISSRELSERLSEVFILDVRSRREFEEGHLSESFLIPLPELLDRYNEIPSDKPIVVVCLHGIRSYTAAAMLHAHQIAPVYSLSGGLDAWVQEIGPLIRE